jgi:hypothetical protein
VLLRVFPELGIREIPPDEQGFPRRESNSEEDASDFNADEY